MERLPKLNFIFFLAVLAIYTSCKKDEPCSNCTLQPPVAKAGADWVLTLPEDSILLDGGASTDDGTITKWKWKNVSGPGIYSIRRENAAKTMVGNLHEGVYQFELTVTDNDELIAKDTVQITVQPAAVTARCGGLRSTVTIQLVPFGKLSIARQPASVAISGNKLFIVGSYTGPGTRRMDIYDDATKQWSTADLSSRENIGSVVAIGDKIIVDNYDTSFDIYSITNKTSTSIPLKTWKYDYSLGHLNNKIFFAGGTDAFGSFVNSVDVYDVTTNQWSTSVLSEGRAFPVMVPAENKLYIMGGIAYGLSSEVSDKVDVFDGATNTWSTTSMSKGKVYFGAIHEKGKIYMAGGAYELGGFWEGVPTCDVEIYDVNSKQSTFSSLKEPALVFNQFKRGSQLIFVPRRVSGNQASFELEIYDTATDKWSIGVINSAFPGYFFMFNNELYMAGGQSFNNQFSDQVYKLVF